MPWVCCAFDNVCIMYSPRFGLCIMAFQCFWSTRRSIMASTTWKCSHWLPSGSESVKEELQGSKNIHLTFSFKATRDTLTVSGTWPDNLCHCFDLLNAQNSLRTSDGKKWYTFRAVHFRYMHDHFSACRWLKHPQQRNNSCWILGHRVVTDVKCFQLYMKYFRAGDLMWVCWLRGALAALCNIWYEIGILQHFFFKRQGTTKFSLLLLVRNWNLASTKIIQVLAQTQLSASVIKQILFVFTQM